MSSRGQEGRCRSHPSSSLFFCLTTLFYNSVVVFLYPIYLDLCGDIQSFPPLGSQGVVRSLLRRVLLKTSEPPVGIRPLWVPSEDRIEVRFLVRKGSGDFPECVVYYPYVTRHVIDNLVLCVGGEKPEHERKMKPLLKLCIYTCTYLKCLTFSLL